MTITHRFPLSGGINLSLRQGHGKVVVHAVDDLPEAIVEITADENSGDLADRATIEMDGPTLVVHFPRQGGLPDLIRPWRPNWTGGTTTVVTVPSGTAMKLSSFTATITVSGRSGGADVASASGDIDLDVVDGDLTLRYGNARSSVERVTGSVVVRSGAGDARLGEVGGDLVSGCGSGRLEVGTVHGRVKARSGSGGATLSAVHGDVDVATGAGAMTIGLPAGLSVRLDVNTGSGQVTSDLPIEDTPRDAKGSITVRARTGSGAVHLFRASAA